MFALLILSAFAFRFGVARFLPNNQPEDSRVYSRMARNLLEQHVYSHAETPPYQPSLIRLPGYSLFLAALYSVFGHTNDTSVRVVQALLDTLTCALIALIAWYWEPDAGRKRVTSIAALALAALCPFTTIYVATILSETWASLWAVALCLLATLALRTTNFKRSLWWWTAAGLVGGTSVFFRPDSGLFVAAVGVTLVTSGLFRRRGETQAVRTWQSRLLRTVAQGSVLSLAFMIVLVPWTVRNWREFHLFQPLSPSHGEMPGEFVSLGYYTWLRTWLDDRAYIDPLIWSMGESQIDIEEIPPYAFDSPEEKARVSELLDQYNSPPEVDNAESLQAPAAVASPTPAAAPNMPSRPVDAEQAVAPENDDKDQAAEADHQPPQPNMTPQIDAAFGQIGRERIARAPLRYYLWVPLKRARSLWFGAHSDYYPFAGELFPIKNLDHKTHQQIWLPLFEGLVWMFTMLGIAGGWRLYGSKDFAARRWLLLAALIIFLRLAFFSTMENPEPRYTVEIFPFLSILGGIAIGRLVRIRQIDVQQAAGLLTARASKSQRLERR